MLDTVPRNPCNNLLDAAPHIEMLVGSNLTDDIYPYQTDWAFFISSAKRIDDEHQL